MQGNFILYSNEQLSTSHLQALPKLFITALPISTRSL